MMQVEDYSHTYRNAQATYLYNHVFPLTRLKSSTINYIPCLKKNGLLSWDRGSILYLKDVWFVVVFFQLNAYLTIKYFKLTYISVFTYYAYIHTCEMIMFRDNGFL